MLYFNSDSFFELIALNFGLLKYVANPTHFVILKLS